MKSFLKIALLIACSAMTAATAWAADDAARKRAEDEVRQALNAKLAAYASPDADKYFSFYADDMAICCGENGFWGRDLYYTMWKGLTASGGGNSKAAHRDLRLQVSPEADVVVATYLMPITSAGPNPRDSIFNMTEVWMKTNNRWQVHSLAFASAKDNQATGPAAMATK